MARVGSLNILSDAVPASKLGLETQHGVAIGEGMDNPFNWTVGSTGQVLSGISGNDPAFFTLTGSGGISVNTNTIAKTITITAPTGNTGQVYAGITGLNAAFFTLLGGGGISVNTNTMTQTITISGAISGFSWNVVSGPTTMIPNNGYIVMGGSTVTLTISPTATTGDVIQVVGYGALWNIQLVGQFVNLVTVQATSSLTSTTNFDTITLLCVNPTHYIITTTQGNITIV